MLNGVVARRPTGFRYLDDAPGVLAFAHRGGAGHPELLGLENTVTAFRHASDLGYVYLETDVQATSDGALFAFHDDQLNRMTGSAGSIGDLTAAQVLEHRINGSEPLPTMSELVDAFPEAFFNIDLKNPGAVQPLITLIDERGLHDQVLVGSFQPATLRAFRKAAGDRVATAAHPLEVLAYLLSPSARLADRLTGSFQAFQVPLRRHGVPVVTKRLLAKAHRTGKHVHVWTVDDPDEIKTLVELGVDGLFTDRTDVLREVLTELGHWPEQP